MLYQVGNSTIDDFIWHQLVAKRNEEERPSIGYANFDEDEEEVEEIDQDSTYNPNIPSGSK